MTEYVTVISMIVLGLSLLGPSVARMAQHERDVIAAGLEGHAAADAAAAGPLVREVVSQPAVVNTSHAETPWLMIAAGALALFCAASSIWNYRHRPQPVAEAPAAPQPAAEEGSNSLYLKRRLIFKTISEQMAAALSGQILVSDLMTASPLTVAPTATRKELEGVLKRKGFRHLIVADGKKLLGIMSDHDVLLRSGDTAAEIMTPDPITVPPGMPIDHAINVLLSKRFGCLLVAEEGNVCGIITTSDLIMTLQCSLRALEGITAQLGVEPVTAPEPAKSRSLRKELALT